MNARLPLVTLALAATNGLLAVALMWRLLTGSAVAEIEQVTPGPTQVTPHSWAPPPRIPLDNLTALAVFHKSRNFYVAPPPPVNVQPPPDYRLVGSMTFPGRPASAVLAHAQTGTRARVAVGDVLEGWSIASVTSKVVTLQLDGRSASIVASGGAQGSGLTMVSGAMNVPAASTGSVRVLGNANNR